MTKDQIDVGAVYEVKVCGRLVPVEVLYATSCGWVGRNQVTKREIVFRSARRFRRLIRDAHGMTTQGIMQTAWGEKK
jgi:hypothetical protein